jgi:hypothetical protein
MTSLVHMISIQQGPGQVLVSAKIVFDAALDAHAVARAVNTFEKRLREVRPEVRWCYVECGLPDPP